MSNEYSTESLLRALAASFVADGDIDPAGMTQDEFFDAVSTQVNDFLALPDSALEVTFDHQSNLLEKARAFADQSETDFAIIFYATWIEHWLNWMYLWKARNSGWKQSDTLTLIKQPMNQKIGILWTLAFGTPLDEAIVKSILKIASWRNVFVHYKWPNVDHKPSDSEAQREHAARISAAESVVELLQNLRNQVAFSSAQEMFQGRLTKLEVRAAKPPSSLQ
jgi:hypothetical protein